MKYITFSILVLLFFSCQQEKKINYVEITYLPYLTTSPIPIKCEELDIDVFGKRIKKKKKLSKEFLNKFEKLFSTLKPSEKEGVIDARIKIIINYSNETRDTLCFGAFFGTVLNGHRQKDNKKLLELVKEEIYKIE